MHKGIMKYNDFFICFNKMFRERRSKMFLIQLLVNQVDIVIP